MASLQIFDKLLQFTLFQGMGRDELELVAGHTRFGFVKVEQGQTVVKEGDACTHLCMLTGGTVSVETASDGGAYKMVEQMKAPYIMQPEVIFGYTQRYTMTVRAIDDVNLITIDKEEVVRLSEDFLVFRINLLNIVATQTQKMARQLWRQHTGQLRARVVRFIVNHCVYPAGPKMLYILMNQLATEVNDSRRDVSRVLNDLQDEGLLILHRGRIEIPSLERLISA